MAKKVGDLNKGSQKEEKEKGRKEYEANPDSVNADGLLKTAPTDFDYRKNLPIKKTQFTSDAIYIKFQAIIASQKAEFYAQKSAELDARAERLEKFGSESSRKAASKLARAKQQMVALRQQLLDSGMGAEELDALIETM